jgi:hypothetical protein
LWPTDDFRVNFAYDLPFGDGRTFGSDLRNRYGAAGSVLDRIIGGWSVTGYYTWRSGYAFTPTYTGFDPGNIDQFSGRPDVVPGCKIYTGGGYSATTPYLNESCFTIPANGTLGNAKVGSLVGPHAQMLTIDPYKEFRLPRWESAKLQVGANIWNIFNHPVYGPPTGVINSPTGALLRSDDVIFNTEYFEAREFTFNAKFIF